VLSASITIIFYLPSILVSLISLILKLINCSHYLFPYLLCFPCTVLNEFIDTPWRRIREWKYSFTNLNLSAGWRWVVSFALQSLYPQGRIPRYPLGRRRLGGPQNRSWRCGEENLFTLPGMEPQFQDFKFFWKLFKFLGTTFLARDSLPAPYYF
jgi:hypothetical protein